MVEPQDLDSADERLTCDVCGHEMIGRMCKLICPNCGRRHDCSDREY